MNIGLIDVDGHNFPNLALMKILAFHKAKQIARLGNAVCPPVAIALIRANCADMAYKKPLTTVAQLERAISGA